jgi:hypothetical protein
MTLRDLPGFDPRLLVCSFNHDHNVTPVVGLVADRSSGYGKQALLFFHCAACGIAQNERTRSEVREYPNVDSAGDRGNLFPCGVCFKEFRAFVFRALEQLRQTRLRGKSEL